MDRLATRWNRRARIGIAIAWLACAANAALAVRAAEAGQGTMERMHALSLQSDEDTVRYTDELLQHPERLTDEERFTAQAYRCEALSTLGQWKRVADSSAQLDRDAAATPVRDLVEPASRWMACAGFAAKQRGDLRSALAHFNRAIGWLAARDDLRSTRSFLLFRRGSLYDTLGDYARAIPDLTGALRALQEEPASDEIEAQRNNVLSAIARIELHRGEFASAEGYYRKLADYARHAGDPRGVAVIQAHLGEALAGLGRNDDAAAAYTAALAAAAEAKDPELTGRARIGLARAAVHRGAFADAQRHLDRAQAALADGGSDATLRDADMARMEAFAAARDWPALDHAGTAFLDATRASPDQASLARVHELLAQSAEAQGHFEAALAQQRKAGAIRATVASGQRAEDIAKSRVEFDVAALEARASALDHERAIATMRADAQQARNRLQWWVIALTAVLLVLAAFSIRRHIHAERRMRTLAEQDGLTGIDNRRAVLERAAGVLATLGQASATLAVVDIDHFKQINDRFGHAAGDAVLRAVALALRETLRDTDVLGRIGGEEFLIVLPNATTAQGASVLEGVRRAVEALVLPGVAPGHRITASIGYTGIDARSDLGAAMHEADLALYAAKRNGRDRVEAHMPVAPAA